MSALNIVVVEAESPLLAQVKELGRSQSATLGFLPEGAFDDYAHRKKILAATNSNGDFLGYVCYRVAREMAYVVHMSVAAAYQGQGVARALNDALVVATKDLRGIQLRCRRDYDATRVWPRLGYTRIGERPGRSKEGLPLVIWRIDHGHPDLFSDLDEGSEYSATIRVAMDSNIFIDLDFLNLAPHEESKSLLADWLSDALELRVTAEVSTEIGRNEDEIERSRQMARYRTFLQAVASDQALREHVPRLKALLGEPKNERDESDIRQLAHAIGSSCDVFVTRDQPLLDKCNRVAQDLEIVVMRPAQLIVHVDELMRGAVYKPARFSGTTLTIERVTHADLDALLEAFQLSKLGETKSAFRDLLTASMAASPGTITQVVRDPNVEPPPPVALYSSQLAQRILTIPIFRIQEGSLHETLARHLIFKFLQHAAGEGCLRLTIAEPRPTPAMVAAFQADHFQKIGENWERVLLTQVLPLAQARSAICALKGEQGSDGKRNDDEMDATGAWVAEHVYWPLKIADADLPTFIVPIQDRWAMHLFDEDLAKKDLWGMDRGLAFNREGVYYRAAQPGCLEAPGRILWYVSRNPKQIRACSRLVDVRLGKPKELFRLYKRLGVWNWNDVLLCAKKNMDRTIMALRFDDTTLFKTPVGWDAVQTILNEAQCPSRLQSPHRVPPGVFARIYRQGIEGG